MSRDTLKMLHDAKKHEEPEPMTDTELLQEAYKTIEELQAKLAKHSCKRCEKNYF